MKGALAFDTSNYTTSLAWFSPDGQYQAKKLLEGPPGTLGLRQQDALFQHVKQLPVLAQELSGLELLFGGIVGHRGGVIAGVKGQSALQSPISSPIFSRTKVPRMPLMKAQASWLS